MIDVVQLHVHRCSIGAHAAAGFDTLPEMLALYSPVARFAPPLWVSVPVAAAKRPVPPVITPGSSKRTLELPVGRAWPA
jgi:hypothetical protein